MPQRLSRSCYPRSGVRPQCFLLSKAEVDRNLSQTEFMQIIGRGTGHARTMIFRILPFVNLKDRSLDNLKTSVMLLGTKIRSTRESNTTDQGSGITRRPCPAISFTNVAKALRLFARLLTRKYNALEIENTRMLPRVTSTGAADTARSQKHRQCRELFT